MSDQQLPTTLNVVKHRPNLDAPVPPRAETAPPRAAVPAGDTDARFGPPLQIGDLGSFGTYRILRRLGKGGMGAVYLAEDTRLGRRVALKLCHRANNETSLERFRCEARAAASLRHPNLCPVHECDVIDGVPYFTMAFIEGPTLDRWVEKKRHGLTPRDAALLVRKLALAMQFAHDRGVIHRDLKPSNVAMEGVEPIILDFGLARHGDARLTAEGMILGTPSYMAPEQVEGAVSLIGPACDVYSLGAILYELLTHSPPFDGTALAVLNKVLNEAPVPPSQRVPDLDPRLEAICLKCLDKNPAARWTDMAALAAALTEWIKAPASVTVVAKERQLAPPPSVKNSVTMPLSEAKPPRLRPVRPSRRRSSAGLRPTWQTPVLALLLTAFVVIAVTILVVRARRSPKEPLANEPARTGTPPASASQPIVLQPVAVVAPVRPSLEIEPKEKDVTLIAGSTAPLRVHVLRRGYSGPVSLTLDRLPPGVTAKAVVLPADMDEATLELSANPDSARADDVSKDVFVVATAEGLATEEPLRVLVSPMPALRIDRAPDKVTLRGGQSQSLIVRISRRGCKGTVKLTLEELPPGVLASEAVIAADAEQGSLELSAAIDSPGKADQTIKGVLKAALAGRTDSKSIQVTLAKREVLTPAPTVRGYLHDIIADGPMIALVIPGSRPNLYRAASGVEVRVPLPPLIVDNRGNSRVPTAEEIKALRGDGKLPGYKGTFADLRVDQYAAVELGKGVDGQLAVRAIIVQNVPPGFPPPPPRGLPPLKK